MSRQPVIEALEGLPVALKVTRLARGVSQREVSRQTGVSYPTISRIEAGDDCLLSNAIAILQWIASEAR